VKEIGGERIKLGGGDVCWLVVCGGRMSMEEDVNGRGCHANGTDRGCIGDTRCGQDEREMGRIE
jgi:hypothetical protein